MTLFCSWVDKESHSRLNTGHEELKTDFPQTFTFTRSKSKIETREKRVK